MSLRSQIPTAPSAAAVAAEEALLILDSRRRIQQITPRAGALLARPIDDLIGLDFDALGSLEAMGLTWREQPVF